MSEGSKAAARAERIDWSAVAGALDEWGYARLPGLVAAGECRALARLYDDASRFRKRVDLARQGFGGGGEYQYFARPLPAEVEALRETLYPPLARIANAWAASLGERRRFPPQLARFLARCHRAGQARPTPLLLRYGEDGYNRLHQDLYGELAFPLQVTVLLSDPALEFSGGEFLLVEQRPRMQSRATALALGLGEAVVFPTRERPVRGARGLSRAQLRHGVSRVLSGTRTTLGIIFHDAR